MESRSSFTFRLFAGLVLSLLALAIYAGYTATQVQLLRELQTQIIDRNRRDSLLLVRVQNNLSNLALGMRDMLDGKDGYPLTAWRAQFQRIRSDLDDAFAREAKLGPTRSPEQAQYLAASVTQLWDALDRLFDLAERDEQEARAQIRLSLQSRQAALSTAVSRLLIQNNESEEQAVARTQEIYAKVERNLYIFLVAMLLLIVVVSAYLIKHNRRIFDQVATLSERRSELAQQLISMQENTFRSISRELHDDFGQILTAVGTMMQRVHQQSGRDSLSLRDDLREVQEIVQAALEKARSLSQALHPVLLEEAGLESAVDTYIPVFERRTGVKVRYRKSGGPDRVAPETSVHIYRVLQEALNNVARHSGSQHADVHLALANKSVTLEVEDSGRGLKTRGRDGLGLVSMRERAEMVGGTIAFTAGARGGVLVRFVVPLAETEVADGPTP